MNKQRSPVTDPLERIIRPIVEGQLRSFLKDHPSILEAVTWYKGSKTTREQTFVGSVGKRIIRDLLSADRARLAEAALASSPAPSRKRRPGKHPGASTDGGDTRLPAVAPE